MNPLAQKLAAYRFILASGSPRRQQFLKDLGLEFAIRLKPVEETYPKDLPPAEVVEYLAELKAKPYLPDLSPGVIVITGDTLVCRDRHILGKPQNEEEAFAMLSQLSGETHEVISAVSLCSTTKKVTFHDRTKVIFKNLTPEEIRYYLTTFKPYDKAGAYGIQEWIGKIGIRKIEGSFYTVMGMPVHQLYEALYNF